MFSIAGRNDEFILRELVSPSMANSDHACNAIQTIITRKYLKLHQIEHSTKYKRVIPSLYIISGYSRFSSRTYLDVQYGCKNPAKYIYFLVKRKVRNLIWLCSGPVVRQHSTKSSFLSSAEPISGRLSQSRREKLEEKEDEYEDEGGDDVAVRGGDAERVPYDRQMWKIMYVGDCPLYPVTVEALIFPEKENASPAGITLLHVSYSL